MQLLSVKILHKWFDDFHVLKGITTSFQTGEKGCDFVVPPDQENPHLSVPSIDLKNINRVGSSLKVLS